MTTEALDQVIEITDQRQSQRQKAATFLGVEPDQVCNFLRSVWKTSKGKEPLTDKELTSGIGLIARYELDPLAREISVTRGKDGHPMVIIQIDGWIKVLDRTDHYDGHEQEHVFDDHGKIQKIITKIHSSKRKHPTSYTAYASEYEQVSGFMNAKIPIHMLSLFSLRHAARQFTPIGGNVVTEPEMHSIGQEKSSRPKAADRVPKAKEQWIGWDQIQKEIDDLSTREEGSQYYEVSEGALRSEADKQKLADMIDEHFAGLEDKKAQLEFDEIPASGNAAEV